jgi:hypothetical protein
MRSGYLYCLTNPSMPNVCKVGFTEKNSIERSKNLCSTGVLYNFVFHYDVYLDNNVYKYEKVLFKMLDNSGFKRVRRNKEFFEGKPEDMKYLFSSDLIMKCSKLLKIYGESKLHEYITNYFKAIPDDNSIEIELEEFDTNTTEIMLHGYDNFKTTPDISVEIDSAEFVFIDPPKYEFVLSETCQLQTLYNCLSNIQACFSKEIETSFTVYTNKHSKDKISTDDKTSVFVYYSSKSFEGKSIGRMYPIISPDGKTPEQHTSRRCMTFSNQMPKLLRNTICCEIYHDIDFKNSHPTILNQFFKFNTVICKPLKRYINNRDVILDEVCSWYNITDKDVAKNLFLRLICGGGITNWKKENNLEQYEDDYEFAILFQDEIRESVKKIINLEKYQRFVRYVKSVNKNQGVNPFSVITFVLETIENRCLIELYNHLVSLDYSVGSFEFDGLKIIRKNKEPFPQDDLMSGKEFIKQKTGYDIELVEKIMEQYEPLIKLNNTFVIENDTDISEIVIEKSKNKLKYDTKTKKIYYKKDNCWTTLEQNNELSILVSNYTFILLAGNHKIIYNRYYKHKCSIYNDIVDVIKGKTELMVEDFDILSTETTINKICFKNGVYDFNIGLFLSWNDERTSNIYTTIISPFSYDPECREMLEYINNMLSEQFGKDIFPEFAELLCRALAGHTEDKRWLTVFGSRNSGKGVLCELLEACFGDYIQTANSTSFCKNRGCGDPERDKGMLIPMRHSRLIKINEVESDSVLNGGFIKSVCSGGDTLKGRPMFKSSVSFKIEFTIMICCNDIPKIDTPDANKTRIVVEMPLIYTTEEHIANANDEQKKNLRLIIPDLKSRLKSDKRYLNAFITILFSHYKHHTPTIPLLTTRCKDLMDSPEDTTENILKYFIFDKSEDVITSNSELKIVFKEIRSDLSISNCNLNFKRLLIDNGAVEYHSGIKGLKYVKINMDR